MIKVFFKSAILLIISACSVFGSNSTEQPKYAVIFKQENFEIRKYESYLTASVVVNKSADGEDRNRAFKKLAAFIFGDNKAQGQIEMTSPVLMENKPSQKIKMTSPVVSQELNGKMKMSFMMPSKYTLETLPEPENSEIVINETPTRTLAVLKYSGRSNEKLEAKKSKELISLINQSEYQLKENSQTFFAGYNPPWTLPMMRRNEVMIEVQK